MPDPNIWVSNLQPKHTIAQFCAVTWRIQTTNWVDLPERFRLLPNYFGLCWKVAILIKLSTWSARLFVRYSRAPCYRAVGRGLTC